MLLYLIGRPLYSSVMYLFFSLPLYVVCDRRSTVERNEKEIDLFPSFVYGKVKRVKWYGQQYSVICKQHP